MALSDVDRQLLLIMQVGDVDPVSGDPILPITAGSSGIVVQNLDRLWYAHSERISVHPTLGPEIFGYYFKRSAVQLIIGVLESRVDFSAVGTAMSVRLNQRIQARQIQADRYTKEIIRLEEKLNAVTSPVAGLIQWIEPIPPPVPGQTSSPLQAVGSTNPYVLDANDPRLSGSPYFRPNTSPSTFRQ